MSNRVSAQELMNLTNEAITKKEQVRHEKSLTWIEEHKEEIETIEKHLEVRALAGFSNAELVTVIHTDHKVFPQSARGLYNPIKYHNQGEWKDYFESLGFTVKTESVRTMHADLKSFLVDWHDVKPTPGRSIING
jgi:hypothetical protein